MATQSPLDFGPLQALMDDKTVYRIMVNGPQDVYAERSGSKISKVQVGFESQASLVDILERIAKACGVQIDSDHPLADLRLEDGSRVNIVLPPLALNGPTLTIRKFQPFNLNLERMIAWGTLNEDMAEFLKACIVARLNILVAGSVGSGKTTLINVLSSTIPADERIITVEEIADYRLRHDHVISLESRPPSIEGGGGVTLRDLILNLPRMNPRRIVVGQLMGDEAFEMLRLIDRGYDGTIASIFSNSPAEALERLEMLVKRGEANLPISYLRSLIASSINLIVQQSRMDDGSRRVTAITEIQAGRGGGYDLHDVFVYRQDGWNGEKIDGHFEARPLRARLRQRLMSAHVKLPPCVLVEDKPQD
ncbi:MAG: CpaF family protein [Chloroflexota bacterium]